MNSAGGYSSSNFGSRIQNPDGTKNIRCRQCGKIVARARDAQITSISQCAECQGYPAELVNPKYYQSDPTKIPVPMINPEDEVFLLYEDQAQEDKKVSARWGWLRPLYKAVGWLAKIPAPPPVSKAVSKRKSNKGAFEEMDKE